MYLNSEVYAKHQSFVKVVSCHSGVFNNADTLLALSISHSTLDSGKTKMELVKEQALNICSPFKWSYFLCVLALSSVCLCFGYCYYKNYDAILKYKIMLNQLIKPREFPSFNSNFKLFCNNSIVPPTPFRHNYYVTLIFCSEKNKVNKKRKLVTSQKCKESAKRATYSIHHFWKQDLSANNSLPNFADDLNVHKSASVNKSSTFNIADSFSSLDNNFLKFNSSEQPFISNLLFYFNSESISISTSVNKSISPNFTVSSSKTEYCLARSTGV